MDRTSRVVRLVVRLLLILGLLMPSFLRTTTPTQAGGPADGPTLPLDQPTQTQAAEGTWEMQLTGATLRDVYFADANNGWAVGDAGTILHTSDGGRTWSRQVSGTSGDLHGVAFLSDKIGRVVGTGTQPLYTSDGGTSWVLHGIGTSFFAITLVDTQVGWLVGLGGTIVKMSEGGETWQVQSSGTTSTLHWVSFADTSTGWVVGEGGAILMTDDGGATWSKQGVGTTATTLRGVKFVDRANGWTVGDGGVILHTAYAGVLWQEQASGTSQNLTAVAFVDTLKGWAVGEAGAILHTVDGGATWSGQTSPTSVDLHGVAFVDTLNGWAVGANATILHTADGGLTWEVQSSSTSGTLRGVDFVDSSNGWVVGDGGVILHTSNGGATWLAQASPVTNTLYSVSFVDTSTGWAVGDNGAILKTTSGGATWITQSSGITTTLRSVAFVDANNGWTVGASGVILHTADGGGSWVGQTSGTTLRLNGVAFVDPLNGWAVGGTPSIYAATIQGNILGTSDGGSTWKRQDSAYGFYSVSFPDGCNGWAGGSSTTSTRYGTRPAALFHTPDGVTWSIQYHLSADFMRQWNLYGIAAPDALNVWAVGGTNYRPFGVMLHTSDGGATWETQGTFTNFTLLGVDFVDAQNGWAVGESGTILRYRPSPPFYRGEFVKQSFPAAMYPGSTALAWIELRNTGTATWYREGPNPVTLGTSNPQDRSSPFFTSGDWLSPNRPTRLDQESVAPGETGRFTFILTAPAAQGQYREHFRPLAEGLAWFNEPGIYFDITVTSTAPANPYAAEFVDQFYPSTMLPGQRATAWVELRNTRSVTWYRSGPNPLMLGTSRPSDRPSPFYTPGGWVSPSRPARLDQESVPLGGVGRFTFDLTAPSYTGSYQEYFRPLAEGLTWLNDLGLYFGITVTSTLRTSTTISPSCGGTLTSNDPGRSTTVQAPPNTVTDTAVLTYTYQLSQPTGDFLSIGHFFELTATQQGASLQLLSAPLTITVRYTDAEVTGVPESSLKLYRTSGAQWVTQGITSTVDVARNIITSTSAYLGSFGVLGRPPTRVYIPALTKGYIGW